MELELRHLRIVCAIESAGSLTRAAAAIGMSQPALTAQLKRIERMLGGEVFLRTSRGAEPTALGEFVVSRATPILPLVAEIEESLASLREAVGRTPAALKYMAAPGPLSVGLIAQLKRSLAGIKIETRASQSTAIMLELIRSRQQDLAYAIEYLPLRTERPPDVTEHVAATEPAFVLLPERHRLANQREVALTELRTETWTLPAYSDEGAAAKLYHACTSRGFTPKIGHESTPDVALELISNELAIGLSRATFEPPAGIVACPIAGTPLTLRHVLFWHRDGKVNHIAADLTRAAGRAYANAVGRTPTYRQWLADHPTRESPVGRPKVGRAGVRSHARPFTAPITAHPARLGTAR